MTAPLVLSRRKPSAGIVGAPIIRSYGTLAANTTVLPSTADAHLLILGASLTLTFDTNAVPDRTTVRFYVTQDGTGSRIVTWAGVTWIDGVTPMLSTAANAMDLLEFTFKSSTSSPTWIGRWLYTATATIAGALNVVGNFSVNTNKFTVTASSGDTAIAGSLAGNSTARFGVVALPSGVSSLFTNQNFITISPDTNDGATRAGSIIGLGYGRTAGFFAVTTGGNVGTPATISANTSMAVFRGGAYDGTNYALVGGMLVQTSQSWTTSAHGHRLLFQVVTNGSTTVATALTIENDKSGTFAGALNATGDFAINTSKFTVTASSGNTVVAGTLSVTSDFAVNTSKFTVTASNGNTAVAGTFAVAGLASFGSPASAASARSGDALFANSFGPRGTNNAGTDTRLMIYIDTSDQTTLSCQSARLNISAPATQTTVGAAGGASALPATPLGYWRVALEGIGNVKFPYYND